MEAPTPEPEEESDDDGAFIPSIEQAAEEDLTMKMAEAPEHQGKRNSAATDEPTFVILHFRSAILACSFIILPLAMFEKCQALTYRIRYFLPLGTVSVCLRRLFTAQWR